MAFCGLSLFKFVTMMRLKRASFQLVFQPEMQIIEIAYSAGYGSPEAFTRAFRKEFQQSPSQFRQSPDWSLWHQRYNFPVVRKENVMDVRIIDTDDIRVAVLEHQGPAEQVYKSVIQFIEWRKTSGFSPVSTSRSFGVPYGDPARQDPAEFRFDICGSVQGDIPDNPYGVKLGNIPGGRCAVARHYGSHDNIADTIYGLYRDWLPGSGETVRDFPCYFEYLNLIPDVDECDQETDVFLPLE